MNYQDECAKTWREHLPLSVSDAELLNAALGVAGEAGEFANAVKKQKFYGKPKERDALIDELGDVLYYCAMAATCLGVTLNEVQERNIAKLRKRHGEAFNEAYYNRDGCHTSQ